jgi:hypothetical protein
MGLNCKGLPALMAFKKNLKKLVEFLIKRGTVEVFGNSVDDEELWRCFINVVESAYQACRVFLEQKGVEISGSYRAVFEGVAVEKRDMIEKVISIREMGLAAKSAGQNFVVNVSDVVSCMSLWDMIYERLVVGYRDWLKVLLADHISEYCSSLQEFGLGDMTVRSIIMEGAQLGAFLLINKVENKKEGGCDA